ncbi:Abcb6 [Symbiodinium natans]|uniref:Abcb6 protein n=1 Tax=Symbiodinium natans TaxID=878477 RepID=A0A812NP97_9DINO|nr:Abcb6 [Symbiodinium natans]
MDPDSAAALASALLVLLLACAFAGADVVSGASVYGLGNILFAWHDRSIVSLALPVMFSRVSVPAHLEESFQQRVLTGSMIGMVALLNKHLILGRRISSYGMLLASQVASYVAVLKWRTPLQSTVFTVLSLGVTYCIIDAGYWLLSIRIGVVGVLGILISSCLSGLSGRLYLAVAFAVGTVGLAVAPMLTPILNQFLPIEEIATVHVTVSNFAGDEHFHSSAVEMLIVTANIQISLGYQSIAFLRSVQDRQNALLTVGPGASLSAQGYVLRARRWVLFMCLPYLLQRTVMTGIQSHAFGRFRHWTERMLRLHSFFPQEGRAGTMLKSAASSNFTVEQYADAINGAVEMSFGIISTKLASLPKLMLVPGVVRAKPWLMIAVVPTSMLMDTCKAWVTAHLTAEVEMLHRQLLELANKRRRIELHDMKSEDLIQRSRASRFAQRQWQQVGVQIEDRGMRLKSIQLLHAMADQMYRQQLLGPGIECTLACLMETNYICNADIYLYTTVLENAIDAVLTRQREQATLASMQTKVSVVRHLIHQQSTLHAQKHPRCATTQGSQIVHISSLEYARGQAHIHIPNLTLPMGRVVAVTGANGCGKSTALAYLASCRDGAWTPAGAELLSNAVLSMPSSDIVEIAQQFYWPMFTSPMSWLLFERLDGTGDGDSEELRAARARAWQLLEEFGLTAGPKPSEGLEDETRYLDEVKEDWYGELSGGERCKVEFIQKVFLRHECPPLLLIDEAFAPLDPVSSRHLKRRLKAFCSKSLVLVVHHGAERLDDSFFDDELHFANGTAILQSLH